MIREPAPAKPDYVALNSAQVVAEHDPFCEARYHQFARHLPATARWVLDVGCSVGSGGTALVTQRPAIRAIGLDLLDARLEQLPDRAYVGGLCGLTTAIPADDARFDAIVAGEFIEHLLYADVLPTLAEFHRVLKPAGVLLMTTPTRIRYG